VSKEDSKEGEPNVFFAKQIPTVNSLPEVVPARAQDRKDFTWQFGPVSVSLTAFLTKLYHHNN
jgi:hypothetical protein